MSTKEKTVKILCKCPDGSNLNTIDTPFDPCYTVQVGDTDELAKLHYKCASNAMKIKLGCPCDCHLQVDEKQEQVLISCSFCPIDH